MSEEKGLARPSSHSLLWGIIAAFAVATAAVAGYDFGKSNGYEAAWRDFKLGVLPVRMMLDYPDTYAKSPLPQLQVK